MIIHVLFINVLNEIYVAYNDCYNFNVLINVWTCPPSENFLWSKWYKDIGYFFDKVTGTPNTVATRSFYLLWKEKLNFSYRWVKRKEWRFLFISHPGNLFLSPPHPTENHRKLMLVRISGIINQSCLFPILEVRGITLSLMTNWDYNGVIITQAYKNGVGWLFRICSQTFPSSPLRTWACCKLYLCQGHQPF